MTNKTKIGFAIVGTGSIAETHATAISQVENAELRAVYNRTPEKAEAFVKKFPADIESDLESLLKRDDVDALCITTPSGAHAEPTIQALNAGKHVICEKPLDISVERVNRMIAAAESNDRILAGIFQARFGLGAQTLKKAVEQGRFGRLTLCSAYVKWWRTQQYYDEVAWRGTLELDGGGALINQAIHAVDQLQWLVGMPSEVSAFSSTLAHERIDAEDTLVANLKFPGGGLGSIECATSVSPGFSRRIEICGDRGSAFIEDDSLIVWDFLDEQPEDERIRKGEMTSNLKGGSSDPKAITTEGHRMQIEDLANAILENRAPLIPGAEGRNAVSLVCSIYESAATGQIVKL